MALDVGHKRIGIAISDETGTAAQPLCVVERKNRDADFLQISRLVADNKVEKIVVGVARQSNGELGPVAKKTQSFSRRLGRALKLPVDFVDEANTTVEANQVLMAAHMSRDRRKKVVDMLAASLILRRYLDGERETP
jgi:putative Holliday junction resolvase